MAPNADLMLYFGVSCINLSYYIRSARGCAELDVVLWQANTSQL